jgi:hypothetical protein
MKKAGTFGARKRKLREKVKNNYEIQFKINCRKFEQK